MGAADTAGDATVAPVQIDVVDVSLDGIVLPDAAGGPPVDLGRLGRVLVTLIRHRF